MFPIKNPKKTTATQFIEQLEENTFEKTSPEAEYRDCFLEGATVNDVLMRAHNFNSVGS